MIQELLLGIDICDDYSQVSYYNPQLGGAENLAFSGEGSCMMPTVVCKEKGSDSWLIGEDAYRSALYGKGTMVDKLIKLSLKKGTATIEGVKYTADDLMKIFVEKILEMTKAKTKVNRIAGIVFTFQDKHVEMMEMLAAACKEYGVSRESIRVANHSEAFLFYVLSQPKDLWNNQACMFDLTENGLHYYEFNAIRGRKPQIAEVAHEDMEDAFSLEILETNAGKKLGDTILCSCADKMIGRKIVSSIFLTGKGFEDASWAENFIRKICPKRKVLSGTGLFACGAAYMANDFAQDETVFPYICLCEGRLRSTVSVQVSHEGRERQLVLVAAGSDWYDSKVKTSFIMDGTDTIDFYVTSAAGGIREKLRLQLEDFPKRPNKTTKVDVVATLLSESKIQIHVTDRGFGEFFPGTGQTILREYDI